MPKESFLYPATKPLFDHLEDLSHRSGVSRGMAFEDFLHATVCALGRPLMEDEYLQVIEKHKQGRTGKRGVDKLPEMFATLIQAMEESQRDILGDLFQGGITYGEKGQFLTPEPICQMMARMNMPEEKTGLEGRKTVHDPCCGSGRMLLAAADIQPHWQFVGQDVDLRCVRMTAINLGLRNLYGHAVWGNSLGNTTDLIYETGRVQVWGNVIRKTGRVPLPDREPEVVDVTSTETSDAPIEHSPSKTGEPPPSSSGPRRQLELF
ncbi:MAG: SAM-dependent DNA methyltransferase [Planctomycetaceae bacterium]|nr:SAM-dependent DNA methyltransferase [Planctomycetaceae bacterium]